MYLGREAISAIGWYQKGPCVNYDYTINKIMYKDFNKREITFLHKNHNLFDIKTNKLESY